MDQFKEGYRILMLINRKKESGISTTDRKCIRCITKDINTFNITLEVLRQQKQKGQRIYCSVNSRNIIKAIRLFKKRQLDNDYEDLAEKGNFYCDIYNRFLSCLQNPEARDSRNFLIDLDSQEMSPFLSVYDRLATVTKILLKKETPNGWHFITEPFDSSKFHHPKATILKDGMLFLE